MKDFAVIKTRTLSFSFEATQWNKISFMYSTSYVPFIDWTYCLSLGVNTSSLSLCNTSSCPLLDSMLCLLNTICHHVFVSGYIALHKENTLRISKPSLSFRVSTFYIQFHIVLFTFCLQLRILLHFSFRYISVHFVFHYILADLIFRYMYARFSITCR